MSTTEDYKILEGIAAGDATVIKEFYKKNYAYIKRHILQNSGVDTDAEDVFQDALMVIYQKSILDSLELQVSIKTYFYAVCKNIWRNRLRKKSKEMVDTNLVNTSSGITDVILEDLENIEREQLYRKHFLSMSDRCREILNLFFAGNSMKEIALLIDSSEGYARKKKFECKETLIKMIEKDPIYLELIETSEKK